MVEYIHMPKRENVEVSLYALNGDLYAFYGSNGAGWAPCVAVWSLDDKPSDEHEDQIRVNGKPYAYCTSDDTPEDFGDRLQALTSPEDMSKFATELMIAGLIYERVKDM